MSFRQRKHMHYEAQVPKAQVPKAQVPKAQVPKAQVPKAQADACTRMWEWQVGKDFRSLPGF